MERINQNSLPLLLRMLQDSGPGKDPPKLLSWMTTPPLGESTPVSRHRLASPTNWESGQERQTKKRGKPSTRTSPKSTPVLLPRMTSAPSPEEPPLLLARLSLPNNDLLAREFATKSKSSWIRYPEKDLKETTMVSDSDQRDSERGSRKKTCLGLTLPSTQTDEVTASRPAESYINSVRTSPESSHSYGSPTASLRASPHPSGTVSFEASPLTSIRSSPPCTLSSLMRRERAAWEQLKLYSPWRNPNVRSKPEQNGPQLSEGWQRQSYSFSPTDGRNYKNMPSILRASSQPSTPTRIPKSSCTINQSATGWEEVRTSYSPIINASATSARPSCTPTVSSTREEEERGRQKEATAPREESLPRRTSAGDLTGKVDAGSRRRNATTSMFARVAERSDTERLPALQRNSSEVTNEIRPKYLRYNIWDPNSEFTPNTSDWTLTAEPLEGPPQSAFDNKPVTKTIHENPHLFKIVTPINVDIFETYLATHPNRNFVRSVCDGLREGFWPWAVTPSPGYPTTNNESKPVPADEKRADFLRTQRDFKLEVAKGRFSPHFKQGLLPGMYCMPIYAVPKPHSSNLQLVTDQSYGKYSLNSMIKHDKVTGYPSGK
jgi:hypothetical protein